MQSVPAQGQSPQTFETSADILAKADWNALPVQTGLPWKPRRGKTSSTCRDLDAANPGDAILVVLRRRGSRRNVETWDVRISSSSPTPPTAGP